jgi:hypothetical protein
MNNKNKQSIYLFPKHSYLVGKVNNLVLSIYIPKGENIEIIDFCTVLKPYASYIPYVNKAKLAYNMSRFLKGKPHLNFFSKELTERELSLLVQNFHLKPADNNIVSNNALNRFLTFILVALNPCNCKDIKEFNYSMSCLSIDVKANLALSVFYRYNVHFSDAISAQFDKSFSFESPQISKEYLILPSADKVFLNSETLEFSYEKKTFAVGLIMEIAYAAIYCEPPAYGSTEIPGNLLRCFSHAFSDYLNFLSGVYLASATGSYHMRKDPNLGPFSDYEFALLHSYNLFNANIQNNYPRVFKALNIIYYQNQSDKLDH